MLTPALCYELYRHIVGTYTTVDAIKHRLSAPLAIPVSARTVQTAAAEIIAYCKRRGEYDRLLSAVWREAARDRRQEAFKGLFDVLSKTEITLGVSVTGDIRNPFDKYRENMRSRNALQFFYDLAIRSGQEINVVEMESMFDQCTAAIFAIGATACFRGSRERTRKQDLLFEKQFQCAYFRDIPTYLLVPSCDPRRPTFGSLNKRMSSIVKMHELKRPRESRIKYDGSDFSLIATFSDTCLYLNRENQCFVRHLSDLNDREETLEFPRKKLVFISYSHEDAIYVERVRKHLKTIDGLDTEEIQIWDDTFIKSGDHWFDSIMGAIDSAKVVVLLVSADFFASDFIINHEWPRITAARDRNSLTILPVIVGPSAFEEKDGFKELQAVNSPKEPVVSMDRGKAERVFDNLREAVKTILDAN